MPRFFLISAVLLTAITFQSVAISPAAAQNPLGEAQLSPDNIPPLMRRKLDRAKNILEGLTLEQFDKIASNARSLKLLSTEAGWNVVQTEEYRKQSEDFRRACDTIEKSAAAKDISRAALGYVALAVRCVECHTYMRENKIKLASTPSLLELSLVSTDRAGDVPRGEKSDDLSVKLDD